ncbi:MAG: hypothetical protein HZC48_09930 [Nitrospirae bacterium]|nr:hypothetical protein [Nitrospirota bacterium]
MEEDFTKMSDNQLVAIIAVPPSNAAHRAAAAELHRRQKQYENDNLLLQNRNILLQTWTLRLTIIILILTAIAVVIAILSFVNP